MSEGSVDSQAASQSSTLVVGRVYRGTVSKIIDFGVFVSIDAQKNNIVRDGLVHISQMSDARVNEPSEVVQVGAAVLVKILEIDPQNRIRLSMKAALYKEGGSIPFADEYIEEWFQRMRATGHQPSLEDFCLEHRIERISVGKYLLEPPTQRSSPLPPVKASAALSNKNANRSGANERLTRPCRYRATIRWPISATSSAPIARPAIEHRQPDQ